MGGACLLALGTRSQGNRPRGLGALLAEKFASEGCSVAINYNASEKRARQVAERIAKHFEVQAIAIKGVSSIES